MLSKYFCQSFLKPYKGGQVWFLFQVDSKIYPHETNSLYPLAVIRKDFVSFSAIDATCILLQMESYLYFIANS